MLKNYLKIALRNMTRNRAFSLINIGGLTVGMAVAMLIGLWIYDEMSFDQCHENHTRIAKVWQHDTFNGEVVSFDYMPIPLGKVLHQDYSQYLRHVVMATTPDDHILAFGDKSFSEKGNYMESGAPDMFSLKMIAGSRAALNDPSSIILSSSVANALFGATDPINKVIRLDNSLDLKVTGVYSDLPQNTELFGLRFIAPWKLYERINPGVKDAATQWDNNNWQIFVQIKPNTSFAAVSARIRNLKRSNAPETKVFKPEIFLHPMDRWHLYTGWDKTGAPANGRIEYVWLFAIIGMFVLMLACINFMNLSTARSEKRAKEVGIRKTVGSLRIQLIFQFFCESVLVSIFALLLALLAVELSLPAFNAIADKQISIPWMNVFFWAAAFGFCLLTGLVAGSYPAIYLSAFRPIKVLKGTFRVGRFAAIPRQILVVTQFTVSIALIIGTVIVFQQIQFAKNRPVGYGREGLLAVSLNTSDLRAHFDALRNDLLKTGAIKDMSTSSSPTTDLNSSLGGFEWEGKDPSLQSNFGTIGVTHDFGKTVGWQFVAGRDFSRDYSTDSAAMVINETAVKYTGLKNPVGKTLIWNGRRYTIIGVIKDMVMDSPYQPIYQTVFVLNSSWATTIDIKLNPQISASTALSVIKPVFQRYNPGSPFDYRFAEDEYARKFSAEQQIGKLSALFATLAVFISCLGLFGLASFVAEQRTREIGLRKVLGASVADLWRMLSRDFVFLVLLSCVIAAPVAYYYMNQWLLKYQYHKEISGWIFVAAGASALLISLLTVSYQALKAAWMNPVRSLRSE